MRCLGRFRLFTLLLLTIPLLVRAADVSNLEVVPLDSTLHVTWTPSTDADTAWHVVSAWSGSTLVQSKVVGKTGRVIQLNGLRSGDSYTVRVQAIKNDGNRSPGVEGVYATDP